MMKNTIRKDGRYSNQLLCCGCNKPSGNDPFCDGDTGHVICQRKACIARLGKPMAERIEHYNATIAKR